MKGLSGPERVFDIAIISKVPVMFNRVMFAPEILATIQDLADYYKKEIAQLQVIARTPSPAGFFPKKGSAAGDLR